MKQAPVFDEVGRIGNVTFPERLIKSSRVAHCIKYTIDMLGLLYGDELLVVLY